MNAQLNRALSALAELPTNPRSVARKLVSHVRHARRVATGDPETKRFIAHNRRVWRGWAPRHSDAMILTDLYTVAETNVARSYFLNVLASRHGAAVSSFDGYGADRWVREVYRSFNTDGHMSPRPTEAQAQRAREIAAGLLPTLRSKQDVYDLHIEGIWIGVDVYESYLRSYNKPTVDLADPALAMLVERATALILFWKDVFNGPKRVTAVVASHDCYVDPAVVCKVAWANQIPVYSPNPIYMTRTSHPYGIHSQFSRYRELFRSLPPEEQARGLELGRRQLERRLSGEVGVDMPYSTKSAFGPATAQRLLKESDRTKVLICTHCFFDNPHAYGGMLFLDFTEWLRYLGRISERTEYDWYVKTHPDPLPGTLEAIHDILKEFPRITILPFDASHHQLAAEGLDVALTAYGSVGHEYPALGVQVVNASYNPHIAYDFNWHPTSLDEYETYLLNLGTLKKSIAADDLAEFYYMHHHYRFDDDLVFDSYQRFSTDLTADERVGSAAYKYFLDAFSEKKHRAIIDTMSGFIESGTSHHFSRGPV